MIISVSKLTKKYGNLTAVNDLSLNIREGEIYGLLGPNGAGKTTTISTLLGLNRFDSGKVELLGMDITKEEKKIKKDIGFVPQDIALFEELSAYDNVMFFGKLYGLKGEELKTKVKQALDFTGLWDRRKDYPTKYSGGMKRRLNIACAIVHEPKLLFMDEPTVGVDPQSRNSILESIKTLNKKGTTVIYTSHYMEEIEEICSRIAIIDNGKLIAEGTSEELKEMIIKSEDVFIEVDKTSEELAKDIKTIRGVTVCEAKGRKLNVSSSVGSNNLSEVLDMITKKGYGIVAVNVERPTLETVFLTLTGKKLRD